jgi:hypothetical protein
MFLAMRARTPDKIAATKFMDEESILQERAEEARVARMQARKEKFGNAAKLMVAKEKGVCWSSHEPMVVMLQPDNSMGTADTLDKLCDGTIPKALKRGSNSMRAAAVEKLTSQLNEQDKVAASATALEGRTIAPSCQVFFAWVTAGKTFSLSTLSVGFVTSCTCQTYPNVTAQHWTNLRSWTNLNSLLGMCSHKRNQQQQILGYGKMRCVIYALGQQHFRPN